ncbi:MAG TPA: hypothetical protein VIM73_22210 [Polyangiaceae bacterium]
MKTGVRGCKATLALLALALGRTQPAAAAEACDTTGLPWVRVDFAPGPWSEELEARAFEDLRAGLANRQIAACLGGARAERPPIAVIQIESNSAESARVTVEVEDAVTKKRVRRDVDLSKVPHDGRAFAVALAADELVWASWAELGLSRSSEQSAPPEVVSGVRAQLPERRVGWRVGLRAAGEHFGAGETQLGLDVTLLSPAPSGFNLELAAGLRRGLESEAPNGRVSSTAAGVFVGVGYHLLGGPRSELGLTLGLRGAWVEFSAEAEPDAVSRRLAGLVCFARSGMNGALRVTGPLWLALSGGAGAPLLALEARDAGRAVSGVGGLELFTHFSVLGQL